MTEQPHEDVPREWTETINHRSDPGPLLPTPCERRGHGKASLVASSPVNRTPRPAL